MKSKKRMDLVHKNGKLNFVYSTSNKITSSVSCTNIVLTDAKDNSILELTYTFTGYEILSFSIITRKILSFPTLKEALKEQEKYEKRYEPLKIYK